jgi:hypothetical protein
MDNPARRSSPGSDATSDATSDARFLSRSTVLTLRRALNAYANGWMLEGRFRRAAAMIGEDARRHELLPERMLVGLKREWAALEEVQRLRPVPDRRDLLSTLVTYCIAEFYRGNRAKGARVASPAGASRARGVEAPPFWVSRTAGRPDAGGAGPSREGPGRGSAPIQGEDDRTALDLGAGG